MGRQTSKAKPTENDEPPVGTSSLTRATAIAEMIRNLQVNLDRLEAEQDANDAKDTDLVPGLAPKMDSGEVVLVNGRPVYQTYGERRAGMESAVARQWAKAKSRKLTGLVTAVIEKMVAEDKVQEKELLS